MKLIKGDIEKIYNYKAQLKDSFDLMHDNGGNVLGYFQQESRELGDKRAPSREDKLKLVAGLLIYKDQCLSETNGDDKYTIEAYDVITQIVTETLDLPKYYINIAEAAETGKDFIDDALPQYEEDELDKEKFEEFGINLDNRTNSEKAKDRLIEENTYMANTEKEYMNDHSLPSEQCFSKLVFDNRVFAGINTERVNMTNTLNANKPNPDAVLDAFYNAQGGKTALLNSTADLDRLKSANNLARGDDEYINNARETGEKMASAKLGMYIAYKDKLEARSGWDKFWHPIRTYRENSALKEMKNAIKEDYNLTDENLDNISGIIDHTSQYENIGLFRRDNTKMFLAPTNEEIANKTEEMLSEQIALNQEELDKEIANEFEDVKNDDISLMQENPEMVNNKQLEENHIE